MQFDWLDPKVMGERLARAGLFLLAYELLRAAIVDGIKSHYTIGFDESGLTVSEDYSADVLARDKHIFAASLSWLREQQVIDDTDIAAINGIREHRNKVAHGIHELVAGAEEFVPQEILRLLEHYVRKIDNYWGRLDVELMLEPEQLETVDMDSIVSSRAMVLGYIISGLDGATQ